LSGDESPDPGCTQPDKAKETALKTLITPGQLHAMFGGSSLTTKSLDPLSKKIKPLVNTMGQKY